LPSPQLAPLPLWQAFLASLFLCLAAGAGIAAPAYDFSTVDKHAAQAVADGSTPSVAYAIARNGEILHESAFGMADREGQVAATVHTAYALASATKPITATTLMALQERQQFNLDAPVAELLPELVTPDGDWNGITLRRLLSHTAGLGTYAKIAYGEDIVRAPTLLEEARRYGHAVNPPGRVAEYSNLGYGLLGEVVALKGGGRYADVVRDTVFEPLGMRDAFIHAPDNARTAIAIGYDASLARLPPLLNNTPGAGNAYASAHDLLLFAMFHANPERNRRVLAPATVARMTSRSDDAFQHYYGDAFYGLGWYVRASDHGRRLFWHEGGMPGASTIIKILPDQDVAVVVLSNRSDANALAQSLADELVRTVLPDYAASPLDPVAGYSPLIEQPGFAGQWRGRIQVDDIEVACTIEIAADGAGKLRIQAPWQAAVESPLRAMVNGDSFITALPGRLPSRDIGANDEPLLLLKLVRTGDHLRGAVVAYSSVRRLDYLLPFPTDLRRVQPEPASPQSRNPEILDH